MDRRRLITSTAAAALGLALAPAATARRLGGTPVVLVTADLEAHVVAVELATGRILRRISTAPGPRSIESLRQSAAVIAHTTEGLLTLVDGPSLRVLAEIDGLAEPRYTALHARGRHAYVTDSARRQLVTIDLERRRIVHGLELPGPARHLALHPSGRLIWSALGNKADRIAVIDLADAARPQLARTFSPPFLAHDVGFAPGGGTAWVTAGTERVVGLYDVAATRLMRRIEADAAPQHVTFTSGRVFVASGADGRLRVHRHGGGRTATATIPSGSFNVQQDWQVVFTPSLTLGTLTIFGASGEARRSIRVAKSSHDACFVVSA